VAEARIQSLLDRLRSQVEEVDYPPRSRKGCDSLALEVLDSSLGWSQRPGGILNVVEYLEAGGPISVILQPWLEGGCEVRWLPIYEEYKGLIFHARAALNRAAPRLSITRISATYGYLVASPVYHDEDLHILIAYASSSRDHHRLDELVQEFSQFISQFREVCWESIEYAKWLDDYHRHQRLINIAREHYSRLQRWLEIWVIDDVLYISAPRQLMGLVIGKGGRTVNALREKLKELEKVVKVDVGEAEWLTERYEEHPELRLPKEALELLPELFSLLERLERWATPVALIQRYQNMKRGENEE